MHEIIQLQYSTGHDKYTCMRVDKYRCVLIDKCVIACKMTESGQTTFECVIHMFIENGQLAIWTSHITSSTGSLLSLEINFVHSFPMWMGLGVMRLTLTCSKQSLDDRGHCLICVMQW